MAAQPRRWPADRTPVDGDLYSFRTAPATEFSPNETGRYASLKVLGRKGDGVCIAVLDGIFSAHPTLADIDRLPILREVRLSWGGKPSVWFVVVDYANDLEGVRYVGSRKTSAIERVHLAECRSYSAWNRASLAAEGEWRWKHDRAAYEDEARRSKEAFLARAAVEEERLQKRLKTLTWDALLSEQPFPRWKQDPPFPPPEFVAAARAEMHAAARRLQALGPKPKRALVREVLKSCVQWFNSKDAEFGGVIETEEREDICAALEELAFVARQPSLVSEIDAWRDW